MIIPYSAEWFEARHGKPTASNAWKVMSTIDRFLVVSQVTGEIVSSHLTLETAQKTADKKKTEHTVQHKSEPTTDRENYMIELIAERLTNSQQDHFVSADMERGLEVEPQAIRAYEAETGLITAPAGWVDVGGLWGATPDAAVEGNGLLEVKCPRSTTVIKQRYFSGEMEQKYYWQCMAQMVATGSDWCDLLYFDPRFVYPKHQYWCCRITLANHSEDAEKLTENMAAFANEVARIADKD